MNRLSAPPAAPAEFIELVLDDFEGIDINNQANSLQ
jgi:hypothetical protein